MTARSRPLLDLCHYAPCYVDLPHECVMYQGCEPMHADWAFAGRGMGHKADDSAIASGCRNAHALLTGKVGEALTRDEKREAWLRAHFRTLAYFVEHGWLTANVNKARREGTCA